MTPPKRFTKKEIKEDRLVTTAFKTSEYIQKNPTPFIIGGVVVAVVVAGILLFMWSSNRKETEAAGLYARARMELEAGQQDAGVADLETLASEYTGTLPAGNGALTLANHYYQVKDYDKAMTYFQMVVSDYPEDAMRLSNAASGLAACYEIKGDRLQAAQYFLMAAKAYPTRLWAPAQMKQAVYDYLQAGDTTSAVSVIAELDSLYETSSESMAAQRLLAEIEY